VRRAAPVAIVACALGACGVQDWSFEPVDGDAVDGRGVDGDTADGFARADASRGGCTSDADCPLPSLHCDAAGQCVACVTDSQCTQPGLKRCDFMLETCVQCGDDNDCEPNQLCEVTSHVCVSSCMNNQVCPANEQCVQPRGLCVACQHNEDCANEKGPTSAPLICNTAIGQCVECTSDLGCPADQSCDQTTDRCVDCLTNFDCPPYAFCNPNTHVCTGPLDASTRDAPDMTDATIGR
jgi:hypothetical protein